LVTLIGVYLLIGTYKLVIPDFITIDYDIFKANLTDEDTSGGKTNV
jgi:hypothetical protein